MFRLDIKPALTAYREDISEHIATANDLPDRSAQP